MYESFLAAVSAHGHCAAWCGLSIVTAWRSVTHRDFDLRRVKWLYVTLPVTHVAEKRKSQKRKRKKKKICFIWKQVVELAAWIRLSCQQLQPREQNTQWLITQCLAGFKLAPMGWTRCCFSVRQTKGVPWSRVLFFFNRHRYSALP